MNVPLKRLIFGFVIAVATQTAMGQAQLMLSVDGDTVSVTGTGGPADPAATSAAGGITYDLFLDSTADILDIEATITTRRGFTVFNDTDPSHDASDTAPPIPALLGVFTDLRADTWITTPGTTSPVNDASFAAGETVTHFDTTNDGPQSSFHWASITLLPVESESGFCVEFEATIQTAGSPDPSTNEVSFTIEDTGGGCSVPEPGCLVLLVPAMVVAGRMRRRRQ